MSAPAKPYLGRTGTSVAAVLLFLVAGVALVAAVVLPINQLTQPGGSVVVTPADPPEDLDLGLAGLPEGVSVVPASADALLVAFELPAGLRALTELPTVLTLLGLAVGSWLLARVLTTIRDGRPFDARNPHRLAGIAAAVVLAGLVGPLTERPVAAAVLSHLGLDGPGSPLTLVLLDVPLTPVGLALVLLAAAEAFRRGGALEHEVEGMV